MFVNSLSVNSSKVDYLPRYSVFCKTPVPTFRTLPPYQVTKSIKLKNNANPYIMFWDSKLIFTTKMIRELEIKTETEKSQSILFNRDFEHIRTHHSFQNNYILELFNRFL